MTAPCALLRGVSAETLRHHGFADPAAAHQAADCARIWAAQHNHPRPAALHEKRPQ
ncbi:hypothetical protein [Streptomyces sp. NPDC051546]|uniref:hypothetical protein n=1 Tax=Streptomyces sp. NPDC051546 TaxID=3365655 RepID=UPI0037A9D74D